MLETSLAYQFFTFRIHFIPTVYFLQTVNIVLILFNYNFILNVSDRLKSVPF